MTARQFCCLLVLILAAAGPLPGQDEGRRLPGTSSPLTESVPEGTVSAGVLSLRLRDVLDRAIRNNLSAVLGTEAERVAAARRLQDLAELFPKVDVYVASEQRQTNLAAFGFSGFPGVSQVVGPYSLVDARANLSVPLLDLERRYNLRESSELERSAALAQQNTRELVVLTAVDFYFQIVSSQSRVSAVQAQLTRATALHQRAADLKDAGVIPGIDVLRSEVEQRSLEQRLIQASNLVEKEKLVLARAIGLPLEQQFELVDGLPEAVSDVPPVRELLTQAYANRPDAMSAESQVRAAEEAVRATSARRLPTIELRGDYGAIGRTPGNTHGSYSARAELRVPIFDRSIDADRGEKESELRQMQAQRDSLRARIEFEVRSSLLDLQSAADQLEVSRAVRDLARQQLDQAQDRFSAGVANNLEVVQAQESQALADEGVIQSLYAFNIARALLARATGSAERSITNFFEGGR